MRFTSGRTYSLAIAAMLAIMLLPVGISQATQPAAQSATLLDSNGDGRLDSVEMVFTHAMDDATIRPGDFRIGGVAATGFSTEVGGDADADDDRFTLTFPPGAAPDTGATPSLEYTRGTAADEDGNALGTITSPFSTTDGAAPRILGALYDGATVTVVFSEPPVATDDDLEDDNDFCVLDDASGTPTRVDVTAQGPAGRYVVLTLGSALAQPVDATVAAVEDAGSCDGAAAVEDGAAVPNPTPTNAVGIQETVAIVAAVGSAGSDRITVTFDFPVDGGGDSDDLLPADFTAGGLSAAIDTVDHVAGSPIAVLILDGELTDADVGTATLGVATGAVEGHGTDEPVDDAVSETVEDTEGPRLVSAETLDLGDGGGGGPNGVIDTIRLTFGEHIDDTTFDAADFAVKNGLTGVPIADSVPSGDGSACGTVSPDVADDQVAFLCLDESALTSAQAMHGGVLPAVSYTPGGLTDTASNPAVAVADLIAQDQAAPVILTATTIDGGGRPGFIDGYQLVFSEPMADSTFTKGDWDIDGYTFTTSGFSTGGTADDATWVLHVVEDAAPDSGDTPELTYTPGDAKDAHDVPLAAVATGDVDEEDGAPPALISAVASSGSTSVTLTFSEGVRRSGGNPVTANQLQYRDVGTGGATDISSVSHTADAATATVTLDDDVASGDLGKDWIGLTAAVIDAEGNTASEPLNRRPLATSAPSDTTPPGAVGTVTVEGAGSDSVTLSWTAPGDDGSTGTVTGYIVKQSSSTITASDFDAATTVPDASLSFDPLPLAASGSAQEVTVSGLSGNDPIHFALRAVDDVGRVGTPSSSVTASLDNTAPGSVGTVTAAAEGASGATLSFTAPGDDGTTGTVAGYEVRRSGSAITSSNVASATAIDADDLSFDPSTLAAAGSDQEITVSGLQPETSYHFAVRAVDEAGNEGPWSFTASAITTAGDTTPPTGTLIITSGTHDEGTPSLDTDPEFEWTPLTDPESDVTYRHAFNQDEDHELGSGDPTQAGVSISFTDVAPGAWFLHVRGESAGGQSDQVTYGVIIDTTIDIADVNEDLRSTLNVERDGDDNVLTWSIAALDDEPDGIQVWRATSPYAWIATLEPGDAEYDAARYVDEGADAGARYLITAFFGDTNLLGFAAAGDDLTALPGYEDATDEELEGLGASADVSDPSGWSTLVIILIVVGAVLVIALVIILIVVAARKRNRGTDEDWEDIPAAEEDGWQASPEDAEWEAVGADDAEDWGKVSEAQYSAEPSAEDWGDWDSGWAADDAGAEGTDEEVGPEDTPEEETFHLRCPRCDHGFEAVGVRPVKTTCPNCGVRGVLP